MKNMTNTGKMILAGLILAKAGKPKESASILIKAYEADKAGFDDYIAGVKESVTLFAKSDMDEEDVEDVEDEEEMEDEEDVLPDENIEEGVSDAVDELNVDEETARLLSSIQY